MTTKLGRRFVYNSEKDESFWKFPPDVMKGVIEYDRLQREKRIKPEKVESIDAEDTEQAAVEAQLVTIRDNIPTAARAPASTLASIQQATFPALDSDGGEYEEIEVTDEEEEEKEEENPSKRQKTNERSAEQSVEFDENDIAFQLAAMGQDYGLDPGEYGDGEGEELEEGAEGLALTEDDAKALFKELLSDYGISPYTTWEKVIETGHIIEDERYTVLPNMRSRKVVWDEWAHAMIQHLKDEREKEEKKDPKIPYFAFLEKYATPKLYWPEFRRKYKKEPEMHNNKLSDKDREKWYREYISRKSPTHVDSARPLINFIGLKLPESTLKADLVKLLKSTPPHALNRSTTLNTLPSFILTDHRYISLRPSIRDPMIETHISTLLPAPAEFPISPEEQETRARAKHDRERREKALGERQQQVQEEKRKQRVALQYSQGILREGENEVERAMKVGKEGLLGHMEEASRRVSMASSSEDAVSASCGLRGS